jgi:hypothetical protein
MNMMKSKIKLFLTLSVLMVTFLISGCSDSGAQRVQGLSSDEVVKTFFEAAKAGRMNEAGLYVSTSPTNDPRTVIKYLSGQSGLEELKNANLLSLKKVTEQSNFSVVMATLQPEPNSLKILVKPVGLEKVKGEWYIVSADKIYQDAKYQLLQQLLSNM